MTSPAPSTSTSETSAHAASKLRHEFYQTDSHVVVSVFIKNVNKDDFNYELHPRSLSMHIKLQSGSETVFDLDPFAREIDPAASTVKVMSTKIEASLKKAKPGVKWNKLEARRKNNWDSMAADIAKEEEASRNKKSDDPNNAGDPNELFKMLFQNGTDEQRMAMMKSYQESNGTALSTDWKDVSSRKVETSPPDGVNARDWSGKDAKYESRDDGFMSWAKGGKKAPAS